MSKNIMNKFIGIVVFALSLSAAGVCSAHGGGGWHGGGGGWHGGWGGGGWHGGGWHGGYYHSGWHGGYGGWGTGVVIGAPYYNDYYYPSCQTVRVCNRYGHCWLQESCY